MRNSSVEVRVVVLTEGWPAVFMVVVFEALFVVFGFAFVMEAEDEVVIDVVCSVADAPVACCRPLPCSLIMVGPILASFWRSWGTSFERTRSLTGCFEDSSE